MNVLVYFDLSFYCSLPYCELPFTVLVNLCLGTGEIDCMLLQKLATNVRDYYAIDVSQAMLELTEQNVSKLNTRLILRASK